MGVTCVSNGEGAYESHVDQSSQFPVSPIPTGHGQQRLKSEAYGAPSWPFNTPGPLKIYYGFKPVATPYGNITSEEYGQDIKRYAPELSQNFLDESDNYKRNAVFKRETAAAPSESQGQRNEEEFLIRKTRNKREAEEKPLTGDYEDEIIYRIRLLPEKRKGGQGGSSKGRIDTRPALIASSAETKESLSAPEKNVHDGGAKVKESVDDSEKDSEKELEKNSGTADEEEKRDSYLAGIRNAVISTALDLAVGFTQLSTDWLSQLVPFTNSEKSFKSSNPTESSNTSEKESRSKDVKNKETMESHSTEESAQNKSVKTLDVDSHNTSNSTSRNNTSFSVNNYTDPRQIVKRYFSLVKNILKDVSTEVEKEMQS